MGAFASRVTVMTGEATRIAATKVRDKALAAAASLLQSAPETLDIIDGKVVRKGAAQGPSVTLGEIARALLPAAKLLGDALPGLSAEGWFESHHMAYPYGVHVAVVRVDRGSGATIVERYLVAYDIGKAVNPMLVEGQITGGVAQGIGGALFEEFLYDARGAGRGFDHGGRAEPAQSARPQGRRRRRRQSRRRHDRRGDR
jgi:carbon-monoxide dehydrogenase large subunit/6-hydroxypseudooxynicotine dehydrogenase subunit gamma